MKTSLKVIVIATGIAALASPVMAETFVATDTVVPAENLRNTYNPPLSEDNVFWGLENAPPHQHAYGYVAHHRRTYRIEPGMPDSSAVSPSGIIDCVHVTFPQCSGTP
jgi:hypothetical protein